MTNVLSGIISQIWYYRRFSRTFPIIYSEDGLQRRRFFAGPSIKVKWTEGQGVPQFSG